MPRLVSSLPHFGLWLLIVPLVAACARQPTETDLKQVYAQSLQDANVIATRIGGQHMKIELKDFKKLGCQPASQPHSFHCTFEAGLILPFIGWSRQPGELTLIRQQNQWVIAPLD